MRILWPLLLPLTQQFAPVCGAPPLGIKRLAVRNVDPASSSGLPNAVDGATGGQRRRDISSAAWLRQNADALAASGVVLAASVLGPRVARRLINQNVQQALSTLQYLKQDRLFYPCFDRKLKELEEVSDDEQTTLPFLSLPHVNSHTLFFSPSISGPHIICLALRPTGEVIDH
jgi:hypothetical protein